MDFHIYVFEDNQFFLGFEVGILLFWSKNYPLDFDGSISASSIFLSSSKSITISYIRVLDLSSTCVQILLKTPCVISKCTAFL